MWGKYCSIFVCAVCIALVVGLSNPARAASHEYRVASFNCQWLFDADTSNNSGSGATNSAASEAEYVKHLAGIAAWIIKVDADVVALVEIEDEDVVVELTEEIVRLGGPTYNHLFVDGGSSGDNSTQQDVALLSLFPSSASRLDTEMSALQDLDGNTYKRLTKHLFATVTFPAGGEIDFMVCHLRAGGYAVNERVKQGRCAHSVIKNDIIAGRNIIVLGDLNITETPLDTHIEDAYNEGHYFFAGRDTATTDDDLYDLIEFMNYSYGRTSSHYSYDANALDRILVSRDLAFVDSDQHDLVDDWWIKDFGVLRVNPDVSDHYIIYADLIYVE